MKSTILPALLFAALFSTAPLRAADCASYEMLHTFADAPRPMDSGFHDAHRLPMIFAPDGTAYFMFQGGGESGEGTIQKMTPAGDISTLVHFSGSGGPAPGADPRTGLTWGPDGHLYGFTRSGSNNVQPNGSYSGLGVFFRCTTAGAYTALFTQPLGNSHSICGSLVLASDGNFYGMTEDGGATNDGKIFRISPSGTGYTELATFSGSSTTLGPLEGERPQGSLVERVDGGTPYLYGVVRNSGGSGSNWGKVFKFALPPAGAAAGSLVPQTVVQFQRTVAPFGASPVNGLFKAPEGTLYGSTSDANSGPGSVIYKIDAAGNYGLVYNISSGTGTLAQSVARTTPILRPDGFLYFTTAGNGGSLMRVRPDGTGAQTIVSYISFNSTVPAPAGRWSLYAPGQLAVRPTDNMIVALSGYQGYVATGTYAGRTTYGSLFTLNTSTLAWTNLKDFHLHTTPDAPSLPNASLIEEGDYWYGTSYQGGSADGNSEGTGALYRMHKTTRAVETLYSFNTSAAISPGIWPQGNLRADTGPIAGRRYLYGTCTDGTLGSTGGCVWRYDLTANTLTGLVQFTYSNSIALSPTVLHGETPVGQLENGGDGYLYGVTAGGGQNGAGLARGTIYRINLNDGTGQTIHTFNGNSGTFTSIGSGAATAYGNVPLTGLTAAHRYGDPAQPMVLYGVTSTDERVTSAAGPSAAKGTLFYITTGATPVFTHVLQFGGVSNLVPGSSPRGKLLAHGTGAGWALYGTTETGGLDGGVGSRQDGTVFRVGHSVSGVSYLMLAAFEYFSPAGAFKGYSPREGVVPGPDGRLYGTTRHSSEGVSTPWQRQGGIFRIESLTTAGQLPTEIASFTGYSSFGNTPGINSPYGGYSQGIPLTVGSDGHLLGATQEGGLGDGVLYRVKIGSEVQTLAAAPVAPTTATLNASVTVNNETPQVRWTWWPVTNPGLASTVTVSANTGTGTYGQNVTGLTAGTSYTFRAEVISCGGRFVRDGGTQNFTTSGGANVYDQWKQTHFGANATNAAIAGDNADPDKDGIPNLLEFMTDSIPATKSLPALEIYRSQLGIFTNGGGAANEPILGFNYWRRTNAGPGYQLLLQHSVNLQTWQTLGETGGFDPFNPPDFHHEPAFEWDIGDEGPIKIYSCRTNACAWFGFTPVQSSTKRYFRLKATRP